jgi:OCT family organic cation transporter-like MFS transporter 4/5
MSSKNLNMDVSDITGDWGPWQRNIFLFLFFGAMFSAFHGLGLSFYAPDIDYWCADDAKMVDPAESPWSNNTDQCKMTFNGSVIDCKSWSYDTSFYESSIITEWDLVCDKSWLVSFSQSSYMIGMMVSTILFGYLSDKYGRRLVIMGGIVIEVIAGFSCAFSYSWIQFLISRFFLSLGQTGRWSTGFVIILEITGKKYRSDMGTAIQFGWAFGAILLPGVAFLARNFRYVQLTACVPELLFFSGFYFLPESPRWLLTHGRVQEAEKVIRYGAAKNGYTTPDINSRLKHLMKKYTDELEKQTNNKPPAVSLIGLWKTPNMRRATLVLYFTWFVCTFAYYGFSLNTNDLGGDPFINFLISGAVEFPAYALAMVVIKRFGRRKPLILFLVIGGIASLSTSGFLGDDSFNYSLRVTLAMLGKFCVTSAVGINYVYSAEVFPTVLRNIGVGSCSMVGRIGSTLSPFVKELGQMTTPVVPHILFGLFFVVDAVAIFFILHDTSTQEMPDTVQEAETQAVRQS